MSTFARRLLVTIAVPLLLVLLADRIRLPGVPEIDPRVGSTPQLGIFALGIVPAVIAYQIVEVLAFLVPPLARRRHAGPEARALLDTFARVLTLILAAVQGFGVALSIAATDIAPNISVPLVTVSLVGGVCVYFVAARFISRFGLMNGFALIIGVSALREIATAFARLVGITSAPQGSGLTDMFGARTFGTPLAMLIGFAAIGAVIAATIFAVRGRDAVSETITTDRDLGGGPYRGARALVLHPFVPIPASSYAAYFIASSLLMFPATLASLRVPGARALQSVISSDAFTPIFLGTLAIVMVALALVLHRPREMSDLAARLGAARGGERDARAMVVKSLLPSFLFFTVIALAGLPSKMGIALVPVVVVVAIDLIAAIRIGLREPDLISVWEERRAAAVPALRAALAVEGIASRPRGTAMLSLWQVFAPYAPAEILVAKTDAERAVEILRHLIVGDEAPASKSAAPAKLDDRPRWSPKLRTAWLAAAAALTVLLTLAVHARDEIGAAAVEDFGPPPKLEVTRIDDSVDAFKLVSDADLPENQGISIYVENTPLGPGQTAQGHFARCVLRPGETRAAAKARFRAWLDTVRMPEGAPSSARFGIEDVTDFDPDTNKSTLIGLRSFVLVRAPVLVTEDVADAAVSQSDPDGQVYVAVTLSPSGAKKFEDATREWVNRRLAIIVDDQIDSAPVIKSVIGGGRMSITMGVGDPEEQVRDAKKLASSLRRKRKTY